MAPSDKGRERWFDQRILIWVAAAIFVGLISLTWISMGKGRSESFSLLVGQGTTFAEALAQASENAIMADGRYDRLLISRYSDLVSGLDASLSGKEKDYENLLFFVRLFGLRSVYLFDDSGHFTDGANILGEQVFPPEFVVREVAELIGDPESNFVLLSDSDDENLRRINYFLELTNRLDKVIVIEAEELFHDDAFENTGIGFLVQRLAREPGVEYILYQTPDGIIFSSRRPGQLLAIESDPFLKSALKSDTIVHRRHLFHDKEVLELVRPFASAEFPLGLFRVGLSLDQYERVSSGIHQRMLILLASLLILALVFLLWLNSMKKRREIGRKYTRMKSYADHIYDQMQTGVVVVESGGRIRLANAAFDRILGLISSTGRLWKEVAGKRYPQLLDLVSSPSIESGRDEIELSVDAGGNTKTLLIVRSTLMDAPDGKPSTILVVSDITRLKEFERLSNRRERLSEMGNLAAGVAHEIRNPLNSISIAAQRLSQEFRVENGQDEFDSMTAKIRSETTRLNGIITRFLSLARDREAKLRNVDVGDFLHEIRALLHDEAESCDIRLEIESAGSPVVRWDPDKMKQVFLNLFANSREALNGKRGQVSIRAYEENKVVHILFADDGPGIPQGSSEKMFTPYFTTKDSGTGLGLSVVHKIVNELSGDIEPIKSKLGGAAFKMTFPTTERVD